MITSTPNRTKIDKLLAIAVLVAAIAVSLMLEARPAYASTTFTVTNTNDSGPGSLRQAILDANDTSGADVIEFDIPGGDVHTISPTSALPTVTGPVTINGYSQPGAEPNGKAVGNDAVLKIQLGGANAGTADGLRIGASNSTVKGLVINFWDTGIRIGGSAATGNRVAGNFIGTDASGTQDLGNSRGVYVAGSPNNTIGGATAAERNVISGNEGEGVNVDGSGGNKVTGNYIGTDATGTKDLGNAQSGVVLDNAPDNVVGGMTAGERNVISGNGSTGVVISGRGGNRVMGNYIGTARNGTTPLGNDDQGVFIGSSPNNTVGGSSAGARNVISANDDGVLIFNASGNRVLGNYVGTDASGTQDVGNAADGVILSDASSTIIGGVTAGERNVISGNASDGVYVYGTGGNEIVGNYIGTNASGTRAVRNGGIGVNIDRAPDNVVGGTTTGERNVVSGNFVGVLVEGAAATGNKVVGNFVGTDKNGTAPLGNYHGVLISGASGNTIGGMAAGSRNVISASQLYGVGVFGDTATGNRILSNSIFSNVELGIDLLDGGNRGRTDNDPGDIDTGPNGLQNFPVLSSAKKGATGTTTIRGTLDSTPNKAFTVQFFSNPEGGDEGKTLLGSATVETNGTGVASFAFSTKKTIRLGQNVTATATGAEGTSEFSGPKKVVAR